MHKPSLTSVEEKMLSMLVAEPSDTEDGQIRKLKLIKDLLGDPREGGFTMRHITVEEKGAGSEQPLQNLIVHKGTERNPRFTVMIPVHIDTVSKSKSWMDAHEMKPDPLHPDHLLGLGVFDMQAALLNSIMLIKTLQVPEGMSVYFVFTVDEESKSRGAKALMEHWPEWEQVDLVLSSEIGAHNSLEADINRMRVVIGRCGIIKFDTEITVEAGVHAGLDRERNAITARRRWFNALEQQFYSENPTLVLPAELGSLRKQHPLLGTEELQEWRNRTPDSVIGATHPLRDEFGYKVQLVPPSTLQMALRIQIECFDQIKAQLGWHARSIHGWLTKNATQKSYPPFLIAEDHPLVATVATGLHEYSVSLNPEKDPSDVKPQFVGSREWSDENLYATEGGKTVLSIPYLGGGAHSPNEWVSKADIARVRDAFHYLLVKTFRPFAKYGKPR